MYIDLIVLIVLIVIVIMFFKKFTSFVFFMAIVDILLRVLTFIKNNIGLKDISDLLGKYVPGSIFEIIDKYSKGSINILLKWAFVIIICFFLYYIIKIFIKKKKI
ncbi:MAG: hypothetical protein IJF92_05035 [Bacilli bacterium]|nr:hypothetical protein [Bacilli bacterium]